MLFNLRICIYFLNRFYFFKNFFFKRTFQIYRKMEKVVGFPGGTSGKNLPASAGDVRNTGSVPGLGRSPGEGCGNQLQYSFLENPVQRGAWRATVCRVAKSQTRLSSHRVDSKGDSCIPYSQFILLKSYIRMMHLLPLIN